jgi:arylformamidase
VIGAGPILSERTAIRERPLPTFVDLSHVIHDGMVTYPGLPPAQLGTVLSREDSRERYAPGVEFHIGTATLCTNTGTYLDTPAHRYEDGWDLTGLPLERCAELPAVVVDQVAVDRAAHDIGQAGRSSSAPPIGFGPADFDGLDLAGVAVLLRTGWSTHWGTDTYADPAHPYLSAAGTDALVAAGVALVGIDSLNIDSTVGHDRPAHSGLLAAGIPIVEHLTGLDAVPATGARFSAVPIKVAGLGTFAVRAFATIPDPPVVDEVVIDGHDVARLAAFWAAITGGSPRVRSDEWATVTPRTADGLVLAFQRVPEAKWVKNRVHLDIGSNDLEGDIERAVGLGAIAKGPIVADDEGRFQVLTDPEGNEFCLVSS